MEFISEYPPAYLLLCLLAGVGYAWLLYTKSSPWSRQTNFWLAGVRALLVTLVALLLLGVFIRQTKNQYENPVWVFALDNSSSLPLLNDTTTLTENLRALEQTAEALQDKGFEVAFRSFEGETQPDELRYNYPTSDLQQLLKGIENDYESVNLAGVVLYSDGMVNLGAMPDLRPYNFRLHTLGIGDTVPRRDLNLRSVQANRLAYLGNKFPLVAEVQQNGFAGEQTEVLLLRNGEVIGRQEVSFPERGEKLQTVRFLAEADKKGVQHFVVRVVPKDGEFTTENNSRNVYVEVLDSRQKILIAAAAPHPDIKAIRAAMEQNENYQIDLAIPGIFPLKQNEKYGLVIFHQLPAKNPKTQALFTRLQGLPVPKVFILGNQSNLNAFNALELEINIQQLGVEQDMVTPVFNGRFDKFRFEQDRQETFAEYPPVRVPFGRYSLSGSSQVMLFQRVGSVQTEKPLLTVSETQDEKISVFVGDGLWRWRLQEFALTGEQLAFDTFVEKWIQYMVARQDKRRFRVRTTDAEFMTTEPVRFEVEAYNEIYEPITGQSIQLEIRDAEGQKRPYSFVNTSPNFQYQVRGLPEGVYSYTARAKVNGKNEESSGQFTVRAFQLEALRTTADFSLLRRLSVENDGVFFPHTRLSALRDTLLSREPVRRIHSREEKSEILDLPWLFGLIVLLAAIEWFFRKFKGGY